MEAQTMWMERCITHYRSWEEIKIGLWQSKSENNACKGGRLGYNTWARAWAQRKSYFNFVYARTVSERTMYKKILHT